MTAYTPAVLKAARKIRALIEPLTLTELAALRDALAGEAPIDPLEGVREPRRPNPDAGETGAALEMET